MITSPAPAVRLRAQWRTSRSPPRRALTLVELLVVIVIMSTLVATVIPLMVPTVEKQRVREAARGVQTFFSSARSRALERGRPVGVLIERLAAAAEPFTDADNNGRYDSGEDYEDLNNNDVYDESGAGATIYYVEVPPPFSGYTTDAAAVVRGADPLFLDVTFGASSGQNWVDQSIPPDFLRPGDTIQFNYQGNVYQFTDPTIDANGYYQGNTLQISLFSGTGAVPVSFTAGSPPMPYQIYRQPQRSSAPPYQLPEGTAIDLYASGFADDYFHEPPGRNNSDPVMILFSSTGALDRVIHNVGTDANPVFPRERPTGTLFLLVGKSENIPAPQAKDARRAPETANWLDLDNVWVTIGHASGQVGTGEMAAQPTGGASGRLDRQLEAARRFARQMRTMGGR